MKEMSKKEKLEQAVKIALKNKWFKKYKIIEIYSLDEKMHTPATYAECDMEKWESVTYVCRGRAEKKDEDDFVLNAYVHFEVTLEIEYKNQNWEVEVENILILS